MDANYVVRVESSGVPVELLVNGVPLAYFSGSEASPTILHANALLISGSNLLEAIVHAAPVASRAVLPWRLPRGVAPEPDTASLQVTVERQVGAQRSSMAPAPVVGRLEWRGNAYQQPVLVTSRFDVVDTVPRWQWLDALAVESQSARNQIVETLRGLHETLAARRVDEFLTTQQIRIGEAASAFGREPADFMEAMRQNLTRSTQEPYMIEPLTADSLDVRPLLNGTLFQVTRGERLPPIRFVRPDGKNSYGIQLIMGNLGGNWIPLR